MATSSSNTLLYRNVIIIGEIGAGKSSIVNLLTGKSSAKVSASQLLCTRFPNDYTVHGANEDEIYNIFDTPGFGEGAGGILTYKGVKRSIEVTINQVSIRNQRGVGLLLFVLKSDRTFSRSAVQFYKDVTSYKVPILLIMTHFDFVSDPDLEISKKMGNFHANNMRFDATIAGCAADADNYPSGQKECILDRRETTKQQILKQLKIHTLIRGWKTTDSNCFVS